MRPLVVFYTSGHGFGHASRDVEVINALAASRPDISLHVRTTAPRWFFDLTARATVTWSEVASDTGAVQIDSLRLDEAETISRAWAFHRTLDARAEAEAQALRSIGASLVVGDIPPLAFAAAHRSGVRAAALGNFTWDWIYAGYERELASAPGLLDTIRDAYARAELAWRLPLNGGFDPFDRVVDVPFIARHSRLDRAGARLRLGLPASDPIALVSFGGHGLDTLDLVRAAAGVPDWVLLATALEPGASGRPRPNLVVLDEMRLYQEGTRYEDLVAAADVVVTKPGYGIIAECVANSTALLYTSRGRFAEYDVLVREIPRILRAAFIPQEDLLAGHWQPSLRSLAARPDPPERPATNGAEVVAREIASLLG